MTSKSKKGFGSSWWAQQWLEALESFGWANRLTRGKTYARNGNVVEIDISPGMVKARVQGNRTTPYKIQISLKTLSQNEWEQVLDALASKAIFSAKLLAGEMPNNIEEVFFSLKVSLFPKFAMDLSTHCTCPDYANPCKHIAAVYYTLAQEFDRDPFLLFRLRGMDREQIMEAIRNRRATYAESVVAEDEEVTSHAMDKHFSRQLLSPSLVNYWTGKMKSANIKIVIEPPLVEQSILKRLGEPPFFAGKMDMIRQLERDYKRILLKAVTVGYKD